MATLTLLLALAIAAAAISAQAGNTHKPHLISAASPSSHIRFIHRRLPPSAIGTHAPSSTIILPNSGGKIHGRGHVPVGRLIKPAPGAGLGAPSPAHGQYALPPEPYPGFYGCLEKLTEQCGGEIYRGIFGKGAVSTRCCGELVGLGKRCHKGILKATLALPELKKTDKKRIKARDLEIWSQCIFITNLKAGGSKLPIKP